MQRIPQVPFGTAGFRGPLKEGLDGLNVETVLKFAQATAISLKDSKKKRIVISYDCRHHSKEFAHLTANVFCGNGFEVHITDTLMPTPYLSFLCHHLDCAAGIMITASHNPSNDNGVKIYESYGGQFLKHEPLLLKSLKLSDPIQLSYENIHFVDKKMVDVYFSKIVKVLKNPFDPSRNELKIVYSPFNGCGATVIPEFLRRCGFTNFTIVEKQFPEDPNFAGFLKPNPEDPKNLTLLKQQLDDLNADIGIATDPDADRVAFIDKHTMFTGNRIAAMALEVLLRQNRPGDVHTSFVSTNLVDAMAAKYQRKVHRYKTGFRYISEALYKNSEQFLMGFEESIGYLLVQGGSYDKDSPHMALFISELAHDLKKQGKTLSDFSEELDEIYGIYREDQVSYELKPGQTGAQFMEQKVLKASIPKVAGKEVLEKTHHEAMGIVLIKIESCEILVRPSGTEPKVKFYIKLGPFKGTKESAKLFMDEVRKDLLKIFS